ncbi:MAG: TrkH family potassium uptake protein, partial [Planctomycetaceae bacterium]
SAGFNTIDLGQLSNGSKLWLSGLMLIGASPAGTGGGMKIIAFALLALTAMSVFSRKDTTVFDRKLSLDTLRTGAAMCLIYLALFGMITLLVSRFMDPRENFIDILFECASACGSSGMSTGLTTRLSDGAKFTLIGGMLLGRLAPMAMLLCVAKRAEAQD